MGNEEQPESDEERPAKRAIGLRVAREKIKKQAAKPERKADRTHHYDLLGEIRKRRVGKVFAGDANVAHQVEKWPVMLDVPNKVRKKEQKRDSAACEDPWRKQESALVREKQPKKQREAKHRGGIFGFETETGDQAENEPTKN